MGRGQGAGCGAAGRGRELGRVLACTPSHRSPRASRRTSRPLGTRHRTLQAGAPARPGDTPAGAPGPSLQPGLPKVLFVRCRRTPGESSTMSLLPFFLVKCMINQSRTFPFHWRFLGRSWTPSKSALRWGRCAHSAQSAGLRLKASHYRAGAGARRRWKEGRGPGPLDRTGQDPAASICPVLPWLRVCPLSSRKACFFRKSEFGRGRVGKSDRDGRRGNGAADPPWV